MGSALKSTPWSTLIISMPETSAAEGAERFCSGNTVFDVNVWKYLLQGREGSLNTSTSGLAEGMQNGGAMAYQADAEGEGSGSDPAGVSICLTCSVHSSLPKFFACFPG